MPGGHFYREALFSFFTSFIAPAQVESMTAASPFMKFIELIGRLCSVTRSCGIIVTSCTRHAFYQFISKRFKLHDFLSRRSLFFTQCSSSWQWTSGNQIAELAFWGNYRHVLSLISKELIVARMYRLLEIF